MKQSDAGTGILCPFREKCRKPYKIKPVNPYPENADPATGVLFLKVVKWYKENKYRKRFLCMFINRWQAIMRV